jgi:flagellar biosynthesis protein FliR
MAQETPEAFRWEDWDWRPLARLITWIVLAALWARWCEAVSVALIQRAFRELLLGWLLSFGLLTYVQALIATGLLRLALAFDDTAYGLSEQLVRLFMRRASFATTFVAAFGVELTFVLGSIRLVAEALR